MILSAELDKPFRLTMPQTGRQSRIEAEANRVVKRFGALPSESRVREDVLELAEDALDEGPQAVQAFSLRVLMAVPYAIWRSQSRWRHREDLIGSFLARAERDWKGCIRQLWRQYLLTFERRDQGTMALARWLRNNADMLPPILRSFSDKYRIMDVDAAPDALADAGLAGNLVHDFEQIGFGLPAFRSSALMPAVLEGIGRKLEQPGRGLPLDQIRTLMNGNPRDVLATSGCSPDAQLAAMGALVSGIVARQRHLDPHDHAPDPALEFIIAFAGDPRASDVLAKQSARRWRQAVPQNVLRVVEQWLSRKTIDAFFRVIDALGRDEMWESRRNFWRQYFPWVSASWLVVGPLGEQHAVKEEIPFGHFARTQNTYPYHCGLLMELRSRSGGGSLLVLEMNANGAAMFWNQNAKRRPTMYDQEFNRDMLLAMKGEPGVAWRPHRPEGSWQNRFRTAILQDIGVSP